MVKPEKENENKNEKTSSGAYRFLLSYLSRHIVRLGTGIVFLMVVDLIQLFIPKIVQKIIDLLSTETFVSQSITHYSLLILGLAFMMVVVRFFWRIMIVGASRKIEKELREDMFSHLQELSFSYFNRTPTGNLMALMVNDVNAVRMASGPSLIALTDALFMGSLSLFFMFSISTKLTFYAIIPLPFVLLLMVKYGPMIRNRFRKVQESFAEISTLTQESFSGIRVVKGYSNEKKEIKGFKEKCDDYVDRNLSLIRVWGVFFPAITLLANLSLACLYIFGGRAVVVQNVTFGEFVSFSMYINLLIWPVVAIGWVFTLLQRGVASAKRILEFLSTKPELSKKVGNGAFVKHNHLDGAIEIRGLSFSYEKVRTRVLEDIHVEVPKGTRLGIIGRPGSGKTTLISLLFGLFPVPDKTIIFDGRNINEIPLGVLRGCMGYVPQDSFLFSDTIQNNITFGLPEEKVSFDEVIDVAQVAGIYDEIISFKNGFETIIGERGVTLSGGQKQRLSLARALLIQPKILILDDALSQVDASKEREILQNIFTRLRGKSMIIISHRITTIKACDNIIVLDRGRIIENGTHDELIKMGGYYSNLYELQKFESAI